MLVAASSSQSVSIMYPAVPVVPELVEGVEGCLGDFQKLGLVAGLFFSGGIPGTSPGMTEAS